MQRLKQRAEKAVSQASRKKDIYNARQQRNNQIRIDRHNAFKFAALRQVTLQARQSRWEDWNMGPLAPVRDVEPAMKAPLGKLLKGAQDQKIPNRVNQAARKARSQKGSRTELREPASHQIKVGDRVCCIATKGEVAQWKGKIGRVIQTMVQDGPRSGCIIEGLGWIPRSRTLKAASISEKTHKHIPIPRHLLVPVRTVTNPYTMQPEDVLIGLPSNLHDAAATPVLDPTDPLSPERTALAMQARQEQMAARAEARAKSLAEAKKEIKEHDSDTLRVDVEARTWTPSLLRAPMPDGVGDELRGKYSKFRTRHEPEFIAKIEEAERRKIEREAANKDGRGMLVAPMKEVSLRDRGEEAVRRLQNAPDGNPDMPPDHVLEILGKKMAERGLSTKKSIPPDVQADIEAQTQHKVGREQSARYWPVKGWKVKGDQRTKRRAEQHDTVD